MCDKFIRGEMCDHFFLYHSAVCFLQRAPHIQQEQVLEVVLAFVATVLAFLTFLVP